MPAALQTDIEYLRQRAERCEHLARLTVHSDRRDTLLLLVQTYRTYAATVAAGRGPDSAAA